MPWHITFVKLLVYRGGNRRLLCTSTSMVSSILELIVLLPCTFLNTPCCRRTVFVCCVAFLLMLCGQTRACFMLVVFRLLHVHCVVMIIRTPITSFGLVRNCVNCNPSIIVYSPCVALAGPGPRVLSCAVWCLPTLLSRVFLVRRLPLWCSRIFLMLCVALGNLVGLKMNTVILLSLMLLTSLLCLLS